MMVKKICLGLVFLFMNCLVTMGQETQHHQEKLIMTGDSLLNSFHIYEAMSYYEEAWLKYEDLRAARGLAECYYRRGDYRKCIAILEGVSSVSQDSLTHESLRQLVYSHKYFKNTLSEIRWGEILLKKYPFDGEMTAEIARVYNLDDVNLPQRANALAKAYCRNDSTNLSVLLQYADSYLFQKDYANALPIYQKLLALGDSTFNVYYSIGMCHVRLENLPEARSYLKDAAEINQHKNIACLYRLGEVCLALDSLNESIHYLELAVQNMMPDHIMMFTTKRALGEAFYKKEQWWNAIYAWREALKNNQTSMATCFNLAQAYGVVEEKEQEAKFYKVFLSMAAQLEEKNEELQKWIEQAIKVVGREYFKKGEILLPNL